MEEKRTAWRFFKPWRFSTDEATVRKAMLNVAGLAPAVVITGGSRGIGLALAQRFLEGGHRVVIVARNAVRLDEAARELGAASTLR